MDLPEEKPTTATTPMRADDDSLSLTIRARTRASARDPTRSCIHRKHWHQANAQARNLFSYMMGQGIH